MHPEVLVVAASSRCFAELLVMPPLGRSPMLSEGWSCQFDLLLIALNETPMIAHFLSVYFFPQPRGQTSILSTITVPKFCNGQLCKE